MTPAELKDVLQNHARWLNNNDKGARANLSRANLREADLSRANLREADLREANLNWANLSGANLHGANLREADLRRANLSGANLHEADLREADLRRANLREADLREANLNWADLSGADLREANLREADLSRANLREADLREANLENIHYDEHTAFYALQCPEDGAFIGWKQCRNGVIVKLQIPAKARRSSATSRKCRAEYVKVLDVLGGDEGISHHDASVVVYRKGKIVKPDSWDNDRWNECSHGIHFFLTRQEAEQYLL